MEIEDVTKLHIDKEFDEQQFRTIGDKGKDNLERWARRAVNTLRKTPTESEKIVAFDLHRKGFKFIPQAMFFMDDINQVVFVDFLLPECKVALEIDGGYHTEVKQQISDRLKDACLEAIGYTVVRIQNDEVRSDRYWQIFTCFRKKPWNCRQAYQDILHKPSREERARRKAFEEKRKKQYKLIAQRQRAKLRAEQHKQNL